MQWIFSIAFCTDKTFFFIEVIYISILYIVQLARAVEYREYSSEEAKDSPKVCHEHDIKQSDVATLVCEIWGT